MYRLVNQHGLVNQHRLVNHHGLVNQHRLVNHHRFVNHRVLHVVASESSHMVSPESSVVTDESLVMELLMGRNHMSGDQCSQQQGESKAGHIAERGSSVDQRSSGVGVS